MCACYRAYVAKALALRDALWIAEESGYKNVYVEGDSKLVMYAIKGSCSILWRLKNIIKDIKWSTTSFDSICWNHVLTEANFWPNVVASIGFCFSNFQIWERRKNYLIVLKLIVIVTLSYHFNFLRKMNKSHVHAGIHT